MFDSEELRRRLQFGTAKVLQCLWNWILISADFSTLVTVLTLLKIERFWKVVENPRNVKQLSLYVLIVVSRLKMVTDVNLNWFVVSKIRASLLNELKITLSRKCSREKFFKLHPVYLPAISAFPATIGVLHFSFSNKGLKVYHVIWKYVLWDSRRALRHVTLPPTHFSMCKKGKQIFYGFEVAHVSAS